LFTLSIFIHAHDDTKGRIFRSNFSKATTMALLTVTAMDNKLLRK